MTARIRLFAIAVSIVLTACSPNKEAGTLQALSNEFFQPAYAELADQSASLSDLSQSFCEQPSEAGLIGLRARWLDTMSAWERVQWIQFGPGVAEQRNWRMQFWPDQNQMVAKRVEAFIRSTEQAPDSIISTERLATSSVMLQGLSSLEYMLFETQASRLHRYANASDGSLRCQFLAANAQRLANTTRAMSNGWQGPQGFANTLVTPSDSNPLFADHQAVVSSLLMAAIYNVEQLKKYKLGYPLGFENQGETKPSLLEWPYSESAKTAMLSNLDGLKLMLQGDKNSAGLLAELPPTAQELRQHVSSELEKLYTQISLAQAPFATSMNDPDQRKILQQAWAVAAHLLADLKRSVPDALGIELGLNANDGD